MSDEKASSPTPRSESESTTGPRGSARAHGRDTEPSTGGAGAVAASAGKDAAPETLKSGGRSEAGMPPVNAARRDAALKELSKSISARERSAKLAPLGVVAATVALLVLIVGGIFYAATRTPDSGSDDQAAATTVSSEEQAPQAAPMPAGPLKPYPETVACQYPAGQASSKPVSGPATADISTKVTPSVVLKTNQGDIPLKLNASQSPCTVNSFVHLAKENFYNDTVCHRLVKSPSMGILQCGDPTGTGSGGPGYSFADEFPSNAVQAADLEKPVNYARGTIAMANSGPNTNGSQFFLVDKDTTLPPKYSVFGTIDEDGLKTLDKIYDSAAEGDAKPAQEIKITSATVNS